MAFLLPLQEASAWLLRHQREDEGWGATPGQASSLVNTAEALYVLAAAGCRDPAVSGGISFFRKNLQRHLAERGPRTRFVALPLFTLLYCFPDADSQLITVLADILLQGRNVDSAWGFDLSDHCSDLFSTYLAVEALRLAPGFEDEIAAAGRWVVSRTGATGWPMHEGQSYSLTATAYAVQVLHHARLEAAPAYRAGRELLLGAVSFENEDSVISGTVWTHCRATAVIRALTLTGVEPFHPALAEAIRSLNKRMIVGQGWGETAGANAPTIRSQFWATYALTLAAANFDIAIHIPRVSAERIQGTLVEPTYLPFLTGTNWHLIVPARAFRWFVYGLVIVGAVLISGIKIPFPSSIPGLDIVVGALLMFSAFFLIRKRPKQFRRGSRWAAVIMAVLAFINAVMGVSVTEVTKSGRVESSVVMNAISAGYAVAVKYIYSHQP